MTKKIEMKFVQTRFFTRWPCMACGGVTEKVNVLCEGFDDEGMREKTRSSNPAANLFREGAIGNPVGNIRVCERCLKAGDVDERLRRSHAAELDAEAAYLRGLVGRLKVPTHAEWQAAEKRANDEDEAKYLKNLASSGYRPTEAEMDECQF